MEKAQNASVRVFARFRPQNEMEKQAEAEGRSHAVVRYHEDEKTVFVKVRPQHFSNRKASHRRMCESRMCVVTTAAATPVCCCREVMAVDVTIACSPGRARMTRT